MKSLANILLIVIYAVSSFGIGIKQFYCCGKLKSTTISYVQQQAGNKKCGKGYCKSRCCRFKFSFYKLEEKHIASATLHSPLKQVSELQAVYPALPEAGFARRQVTVLKNSHAPPLHNGIPAYIYNCVYRI